MAFPGELHFKAVLTTYMVPSTLAAIAVYQARLSRHPRWTKPPWIVWTSTSQHGSGLLALNVSAGPLHRKSATHHGLKPKQTITAQGCHKAWYRLRSPLWSWLCVHPLHGCCPATCSFAKPLGQANWMALPWTAGVVGPQPQQGQCMCSQNQPWYSDTSLTRKAFAGRVGGCLQC